MEQTAYRGRASEARREVKTRVRRFFLHVMDELDKDTEAFFQRVMEQAKRNHRVL